MKLHSLQIQGLRKHMDTSIHFADTTFLIGRNNIGKSTVFKALEYLLSDVRKLEDNDFASILNQEQTANEILTDKITLTAEFRDCPPEAKSWRGIKGRIFLYDTTNYPGESGLKIFYRKTFERGENVVIEMKQCKRTIKECFTSCKTLEDYIKSGLDEQIIIELFKGEDIHKNLVKTQQTKLMELDELYDIDDTTEEWVKNPGGIVGNVLSRLPRFLLIPAQDKVDELSSTNGSLVKTLNSLFDEVREASPNFKEAQKYLNLLQLELDPSDETSSFGSMMKELNHILSDVFPQIRLMAEPNLSDANRVIKPQFDIRMRSDVNTPIENQGTGVIRSAAFAMLRYRNMREYAQTARSLIIAFEEPEIYLHPNAAHQLRDTIYELAGTPNNQIICTTHSPFMIDLSKKSAQVLNHFSGTKDTIIKGTHTYEIERVLAYPFNITEAFQQLQEDDKSYVKMLLRMDDYMAKVFFTENVLVVEGDTEDIVLRETIHRMPEQIRKDILHNWHIVKARGKASIISMVRYLKAMGIHPYVIHDKDTGTAGAEVFNAPIEEVVGSEKRYMLVNCIEDVLGCPVPSAEKPYKAYRYITSNWGEDWDTVSGDWKTIVETLFVDSFKKFEAERREVRRGVGTISRVSATELVPE
ncbi:AAA family ATPase [Bacillus cereus]|uniref:AAA family ATPase n=1 Tax=Bacillus cereus TaxID=1396 RepID=UPI00027ABA0B|nr:AAA family ATPase [Bacillus cereus]EJS68620.1 hypothetical protein ICY_04694 [Bacillus cereus BAG2X1-3]